MSSEARAPETVADSVERDIAGEGGSPSSAPSYTNEAVTPSGIEIRYSAQPKRKYEIRPDPRGSSDPDAEWREVPSVSTVLEVVHKDALSWWGMRVGVLGTLELHTRGLLRSQKLPDGQTVMACAGISPDGSAGLLVAGLEQVEDLLKAYKLTTRDIKSTAGDRGQSAHDALEIWAQTGETPDPEGWPPEEQGYIVALRMFLEALAEGEPEVVGSEVMVGSLEHGFAGRFDLEIRTHKPCQIAKRWTPKRGPQYVTLQPGLYVPDLKTSKHVYETHCIQLEGYELGRVESGYEPSEARGVIHVHPGDPKDKKLPDEPFYEFVKSWAKPETFLAVLALYAALEAMRKEKKR